MLSRQQLQEHQIFLISPLVQFLMFTYIKMSLKTFHILRHIVGVFVELITYAATARVRARVRPCGICGGQNGTGVGFLRVLVFPCQFAFRRLPHNHHHLWLVQ
jgi:hypothetical protein